jgi:hypothetical protein
MRIFSFRGEEVSDGVDVPLLVDVVDMLNDLPGTLAVRIIRNGECEREKKGRERFEAAYRIFGGVLEMRRGDDGLGQPYTLGWI